MFCIPRLNTDLQVPLYHLATLYPLLVSVQFVERVDPFASFLLCISSDTGGCLGHPFQREKETGGQLRIGVVWDFPNREICTESVLHGIAEICKSTHR